MKIHTTTTILVILSLVIITGCSKNKDITQVLGTQVSTPGIISGEITDKDSKPIFGVTIWTEPFTSGVSSKTTGKFKISDVSPGIYTIKTYKAEYADKSESVTVTSGAESTVNIKLSPPKDTTAPSAITTLIASSPTTTSATLSWTATGDDGLVGTAGQYDIRYSTATITESNWSLATQVTGEPTPAVSGTSQSLTITGLTSSMTYYFAMKAADEVPNWSVLSNVVTKVKTFSPVQ
ncbi:MAG: carboxypeptidase regulatory-like domain-containing protein [Candidatus Firestonebacteria bacterium]